MWRTDTLEKTLMLGKIEDKRRREWQRTRWLDSMDRNLNQFQEWRTGKPGVQQSTGSQRVRHSLATEQHILSTVHFYSPRKAYIWNTIFLICHKIFPAENPNIFWHFFKALSSISRFLRVLFLSLWSNNTDLKKNIWIRSYQLGRNVKHCDQVMP